MKPQCQHGQGMTGSGNKRCHDKATLGSIYCAIHRDEALRRVAGVRNDRAAQVKGLRWSKYSV